MRFGTATRSMPVSDPGPNYRIVALVVSTSLFMQYLDTAALTTALPSMSADFAIPATQMTVVLTAYLISLAVFIPAGGVLAERFGARRMFQLSLVLFLLGAMACAFAPTLPLLVCARLVQGIGGAIMIPVGRLIVLRSSQSGNLLSAMNWLMVPTIIGPLMGPVIGGFIATQWSWRWIFAVHIPVGVLGLILSQRLIPPIRDGVLSRFDWRGMFLAGSGLILLVFGLQAFTEGRAASVGGFSLLLVALVFGRAYVFHARRTPQPLLNLSLLDIPTFRISMIAGSFMRMASTASGFLLPMLFQIGFGLTPAESGVITFASVAGALLSRSASVAIVGWFTTRRVILVATGAAAVAMTALSLMRPGWPIWTSWALLVTVGFLHSLALSVLGAVAYVDIEPQQMSAATAFYSTVQQLTMSFGVSLGVLLLAAQQWLGGGEVAGPAYFQRAFLAVAVVLVIGMLAARRLEAEAGGQLRVGRT
ncbi:MFS transporter [Sphingobium sp. TA15]|uniref:Putative MFS permease n=1 Tax=Sphingobium indicum (strain DSM 16413 / CCM 7287 / MTCC 6362 / UT26 / NBRC 101211 / UT26S) TaxID=452662 RepID=D4Z279_SPHIU|nr:MFS transporter [Sphingobium indicum]BAI96711.1 putative MFS permease [Sphingobium indicum UT26S]BDD66146.1 MFS transporter [Sphingobium sp. TA15]